MTKFLHDLLEYDKINGTKFGYEIPEPSNTNLTSEDIIEDINKPLNDIKNEIKNEIKNGFTQLANANNSQLADPNESPKNESEV